MVRLMLRLLGIRDYEVCPSCETLKQQLAIANEEKKEAINTILGIVKPKAITPVELNKDKLPTTGVFSRRQAELENRDRKAAMAMNSPFAVKPATPAEVQETVDEIDRLVKEQEANASEK